MLNRVPRLLEPAAERHVRRARSAGTGFTSSPTTNGSASRSRTSTTARTRSFDMDLVGTRTQYTGGVKVDTQFTPQTRLSVRVTNYHQFIPGSGGGATTHPSAATQVGPLLAADVGAAHAGAQQPGGQRGQGRLLRQQERHQGARRRWNGGAMPAPAHRRTARGVLRVRDRRGIRCGATRSAPPTNAPQMLEQDTWQVRDDFTFSYDARRPPRPADGRRVPEAHVPSLVVQHLQRQPRRDEAGGAVGGRRSPRCSRSGTTRRRGTSLPLGPSSIRFRQSVGNDELLHAAGASTRLVAGRLGDHLAPDAEPRAALRRRHRRRGRAHRAAAVDGRQAAARPRQLRPAARPRASRSTTGRSIRGGYGKYFTQLENDGAHQPTLNAQHIFPEVLYDGRADFAVNPFNGPDADVRAGAGAGVHAGQRSWRPTVSAARSARRFRRRRPPSDLVQPPGVDRRAAAVPHRLRRRGELRLHRRARGGSGLQPEPHLRPRRPATTSRSATSRRGPIPYWGFVNGEYMQGWSNYRALETSLTKRFSHRWQMAANYTFGDALRFDRRSVSDGARRRRDASAASRSRSSSGRMSAASTRSATTDQRHRAVVNGIWDMGAGFQVSGLYFYGSGPAHRRHLLLPGARHRHRRREPPARRRQLRRRATASSASPFTAWTRGCRSGSRSAAAVSIDGMLEVFNLFNRANYGSYTTNVDSAAYGQPVYNSNVAYGSRAAQLGFRFSF